MLYNSWLEESELLGDNFKLSGVGFKIYRISEVNRFFIKSSTYFSNGEKLEMSIFSILENFTINGSVGSSFERAI